MTHRAAVVQEGRVVDIQMVDADGERGGHQIVASDTAGVGDLYDAETGAFSAPATPQSPLSERRAAVVAAINSERDRRLAAGASYGGKLIDVSDRGRADLSGMSIAAMLAQAGSVPWGPGYSQGWITADNSRIPLPTPTDGLRLAASVGDWYGRTVQHARDLKDGVLASDAPEGVSITDGWP